MTNKTELLSCPFCGGAAVKHRASGDERDGYADRVTYSCAKCGCSRGASGDSSKGGYADNSRVEALALEAWNDRAPAEDVRAAGEEPVGKYDEVLKPFMLLMERELHANSHKGDRPAWLKMSAGECLLEIYFHAGKLHKAVHAGDGDGMLEYAADVANLSMMLTDIVGALGLFAHDEAANAKR